MEPESKRWRRRKEARPQEILEAALILFAQKGFAATRINDIAKAAGLTCGTLYLYFANKEEIFKAVMREYLLPRLEMGRQLVQEKKGSARQLLTKLFRFWWMNGVEGPVSALPKIIYAEAGNFPEVVQMLQSEFVQPKDAMLRELIAYGVERGEFRPLDLEALPFVMTAPFIMTMLEKHLPTSVQYEPCREKILEAMLALILDGLAVSKEQTNE